VVHGQQGHVRQHWGFSYFERGAKGMAQIEKAAKLIRQVSPRQRGYETCQDIAAQP
jgi:hypothetical protein